MIEEFPEASGSPSRGGEFPSTHWSDIEQAGHPNPDQSHEALNRLILYYQGALVAYLQRKFGCDEDKAKDWLQDFLAQKVVEQKFFAQARRMRGRLFRCFLLCSIHNFVVSRARADGRKKRMPEGGFVAFDTVEEFEGVEDHDPAFQAGEEAWARQVVFNAIDRMREYCQRENRPDIWGLFEDRLMGPVLEGATPVPFEQLIRQYDLKTPAQAYLLLNHAKRLFHRFLISTLGEYASNDIETECELRELRRILER
jgi:DNA-directed RNA polymerase specialized sigma24 family protein